MRWLLRILKSKTFLISFAFVVLISLVLLLGAYLEWSWTVRLLGIIIVLVVCIAILAISFLRENRSSDEIERSIKKQAEQQLISTRPDRQADIQELQNQLEQAIEKLKQSKLGRGKRGRAALYELPWYLFIGPPGAGKTTAIANSGLNFPIGTDSVRGVGGTRNCDWFFTDSAILLDTAGRYMTEQEDTEEWLAFLDTLKQHRIERPVNGVLVGIAIPDLAIATPDEIQWHADNIRRRCDELVQRLGVKFPVYLVFTKCDMLQGFVEFFGEFSRREREQIWGATLEQQAEAGSDVRPAFEQEFDRLVASLVNRRSARLSRPMKREERQKVYAFPLQLASVKENLAYFVSRLFQPNPYQENPTFRGFYFTSGTQEGVPLDRVILAIARQFELPTTGLHQFASESETKSYFIKDLFTDVVVPDQYMVRRTSKASRKGSLQRVVVSVASVVLLALFALGASQALVRGKMRLNDTRDLASATAQVRWSDQGATVGNLAQIDALRQQVDALDKVQWLGLGLNRNGTVKEPAHELYLDHVRAFVRSTPLRILETRMRQLVSGGRVEGADRESLTESLKAYLLLSNYEESTARLEDENNHNFLVRHLTELALEDLEPQTRDLTRAELRARVEPQVTAYVEALEDDVELAFPSDASLVQVARQRIYEPPTAASLYSRMRLEGRDAVPPVRLENLVPGRYLNLVSSSAEVSGFFTKDGWNSYVADKIQEVSANPTGEDWVMGRSADDAPVNLGSEKEVAAELEDLYFTDYAAAWINFLRSVRVSGFRDLREAARSMSELSDANESPLVYLLAQVTDQTRFDNELAGDLAQQGAQALANRAVGAVQRALRVRPRISAPDTDEPHPIDRRFAWLHNLKADHAQSGEASADLYAAFTALREVSSNLESIGSDPDAAANFARDVLANDGGDLERQLRNIGNALRTVNSDVRSQLFETPVMQAWGTVLGMTQQYLNDRWRNAVAEPFQRQMGSHYPFDVTSDLDAPLFDVEAFFAPQSGTVASFVEEELQPFIGRNIDRPNTWRGSGIRLSSGAVAAIKRAQNIADNAFSGGRMQVSFELQPEQPVRSDGTNPNADQVSMNLLGREVAYRMGTQFWTAYDWPGAAGAVLSLSLQTGDLPPKRFEGDWALFRLLQAARINQRTSAQYELRWDFEDRGSTITVLYNLRTRSAANPFGNARNFFDFRPPNTLN